MPDHTGTIPFTILLVFFLIFAIVDIYYMQERTSDDVVPEEGNTELGKPANELEQHTLSNRISTEEHVQGSSAKQKAARCIENSSCKDVREEGNLS